MEVIYNNFEFSDGLKEFKEYFEKKWDIPIETNINGICNAILLTYIEYDSMKWFEKNSNVYILPSINELSKLIKIKGSKDDENFKIEKFFKNKEMLRELKVLKFSKKEILEKFPNIKLPKIRANVFRIIEKPIILNPKSIKITFTDSIFWKKKIGTYIKRKRIMDREIINHSISNKGEIYKLDKLTYDECCMYLQSKYGIPNKNYFTNENCKYKTKSISKTNEGLFIHHWDEDKEISLSIPNYACTKSFEFQKADRLVYCDYLEYLLLRIKILDHPNPNKNNNHDVGMDGIQNFPFTDINDYYLGFKSRCDWKKHSLNNLNDRYDEYLFLIEKLVTKYKFEYNFFCKSSVIMPFILPDQKDNENFKEKVFHDIKDIFIKNKILPLKNITITFLITGISYIKKNDFHAIGLCSNVCSKRNKNKILELIKWDYNISKNTGTIFQSSETQLWYEKKNDEFIIYNDNNTFVTYSYKYNDETFESNYFKNKKFEMYINELEKNETNSNEKIKKIIDKIIESLEKQETFLELNIDVAKQEIKIIDKIAIFEKEKGNN